MELQQAYRAADAGKRRGCDTAYSFRLKIARRLATAAVLLGSIGFCAPGHAQSGGPFAALAGSWSGGGTVGLDDGSTERIRCRATYAVAGRRMELTLTCASDSYRFSLQGNLEAEGNVISGTWSESSRNVSGVLQGRASGGNYQLRASAAGFNANIALSTRGNRQSVSMRADSQFRSANISLSR
jgi:hypothetical protein